MTTIESIPCHPTISFGDGTLCLVDSNRRYYFNVHKGLICRHSAPLRKAIELLTESISNGTIIRKDERFIEGNLVLELDDEDEDLARFLIAVYDGVSVPFLRVVPEIDGFSRSELKYDVGNFEQVSSLLRLSTKYQVEHVRREIVRGMGFAWPKTLAGWEVREAEATDNQGNYRPRRIYPHPILVINLARETKVEDVLRSAFYDLCRCSGSEIASGYTVGGEIHNLSDGDLGRVLKGREHAARFLTEFIETELESRSCCDTEFEGTRFEMLRDVNRVRTCDPLFAMMDAEVMLGPGACEPCRNGFASAVDAKREEMWLRIPHWFGL